MTQWVYPNGSAAKGDWEVSLGASDSQPVTGWQYTGIRVAKPRKNQVLTLPAADEERLVVPLCQGFDVRTQAGLYHLRGRQNVFTAPTDVVYVGTGTPLEIYAPSGGRVAVASAPASTRHPDQLVKAEDNETVLRGNGPTSRQARNFGMMNNIEAERLLVCEVITPSGSWSSYPVHKHDQNNDHETALEEIYYFQMKALPGASEQARPLAYQGAGTADERPLNIMTEVHPGDTVLIPYGWHGPSIAAPGYDLYYLNVMGGGGQRDWKVTIREDQTWINQALQSQPRNERLPMTD